MFAAPVWASAQVFDNNRNIVQKSQRTISLRVAMAYTTISTPQVILVVSDIVPVHLLVMKLQKRAEGVAAHSEIRNIVIQKW